MSIRRSTLVVRKSNLMKKEKMEQLLRHAQKIDSLTHHHNPGIEQWAKKELLKGRLRTKVADDEILRQEIPSSVEVEKSEIKKDETLQ